MPHPYINAVVANTRGEIFDLDGYAAVGMSGRVLTPLTAGDTIAMPHGSELMRLPQRRPVVYDLDAGQMVKLIENPFAPGEPVYPVAVFNSPGYVNTHACAYGEQRSAGMLPLFSYGAVGWGKGAFRSAAVRVDAEKRQDLRHMPLPKVEAGIRRMRKTLPDNRLCRHLETCALQYGCPAAKNFFIGRFEAPLPASRQCNARCMGCISLQKTPGLTSPQNRITFMPTAEEIAQVALAHIGRVRQSVVSFGQGCEGDPLMAAESITPAIARIRAATQAGTVNMNTNASLPHVLEKMLDAGLDSIRVSLNSLRPACYDAYFRPKGYGFPQVMESIALALARGRFVSINYLNCPGFTDTAEESAALIKFLETYPIHFIQWRNLNFDPLRYTRHMSRVADSGPVTGVKSLLKRIRHDFPKVGFGYFNPPKERFAF